MCTFCNHKNVVLNEDNKSRSWRTHFASHTHKHLRCVLCTEINKKHTCDIHFHSIIDDIYVLHDLFGDNFYTRQFVYYPDGEIPTCPQLVSPVQITNGWVSLYLMLWCSLTVRCCRQCVNILSEDEM